MAAYRVVAPYVVLKVRDHLGAWVVNGFYQGAVVSNVDADSLRHHLDNGLIEDVDAPEAVAAESMDESGEGDRSPATNGRPSVRAAKEDWVTYAVAQRDADVSEEDARATAEGTSKADLVAKYGG